MSISRPLPLRQVNVTDPFWRQEVSLVRREVIPYQWEALNDRVPGAAPSYFMHNMRAAARAVRARKAGQYFPLTQGVTGITSFPPEGAAPDPDYFYGFVFQDSDGYKWVEAVSYQLILQDDPALRRAAQEAVDAIRAAQEEDGYLDTFYTLTGVENAFTNLRDNHELYCFGHLTEAAVAWKQATGQTDLLDAACRFAGCIMRRFGPGRERGCPGHEIAEMALFRLYEETGDVRYRNLALFFLDVRGTEPSTFALEENRRRVRQGLPELPVTAARYAYHQADVPVRETTEARGHAVRQMYLAAGMADAARLTGDGEMLAACERLWRSVTREKLYVTGGVGGTHVGEAFSLPYDLPADTAYSETCAAVGLCFFARRMLELLPLAEYADVMEQALYNTVPAGMAMDGKSFFYVNPLSADPAYCEKDERLAHVKAVRQKWFPCACCPPNIARLLSSLGQYIWTGTEDTLYLHLYIANETEARLNGRPLSLRLDADLTKDGRAALTVTKGEAEGTLAFRVPGWSGGKYTASASWDEGVALPASPDGYLRLTRRWQAGDRVTIDFPMPARLLAAHPMVREMTHQVCFAKGPFVYCAEEKDNGPRLFLLRVPLNAAETAETSRAAVAGRELPALRVPAYRAELPEGDALYRPAGPERLQETVLTLIPYFAWNNRGKGEMRVWLPVKG